MKKQNRQGTGFQLDFPAGYSYALFNKGNKGQRTANASGVKKWGNLTNAQHKKIISDTFNAAVAAKVPIVLEDMKRNIYEQLKAAGYFKGSYVEKLSGYSAFWSHNRQKQELKHLQSLVDAQKASITDSVANKDINSGYDVDGLLGGGDSSTTSDPMLKWMIGGIIGLAVLILGFKLIKGKNA